MRDAPSPQVELFPLDNRAHAYLRPIDQSEALGQGAGDVPDYTYPNFIEIARGFGVPARRVRAKRDVREALKEMIAHSGPYLLDVLIPYQKHVLPMIPVGMTVRDIIKAQSVDQSRLIDQQIILSHLFI
jgi:acetolactate synthase-1/2/3 large subunit